MARLKRKLHDHQHRIAIIDDDPDLVASTQSLFRRDGHELRSATNAEEGIELVRAFRPHLLILDYCLGELTGADVVECIRRFDDQVQVLLFTGYSGGNPGRKLLRTLDIQGYHNKSDGADRLLILADGALKHFRALQRMRRQQGYLRHILDVAPSITCLQAPTELLERALRHLQTLLQAGDSLIATSNHGLFILGPAHQPVSIRAGTGKFLNAQEMSQLPSAARIAVETGLRAKEPTHIPTGHFVIPLSSRNNDRGCMLLETSRMPPDVKEACTIYAQQVMQALENVMLYEMATVDALTRLFNRAHGMQRLREVLKLAARAHQPTSVAMIDVDHFKSINDTYSHAAGDLMLRRIAEVLREQSRESDIVARYGGEELMVVLPQTELEGAIIHMERVRRAIEAMSITFAGEVIRVTASIGVAAALPGYMEHEHLVHIADQGLYRAKRAGRNQVMPGATTPLTSSALPLREELSCAS